jgi:nitrite reductase/ring-hydroxylating ferredoxin subunit
MTVREGAHGRGDGNRIRHGRILEMMPRKPSGSPVRDQRDMAPTSRRSVLQRILAAGLTLPFIGILVAMLRREQTASVPATVVIPPDVPIGLSVLEAAIVSRSDNGTIHVFSSRCTHLGCHIDRIVGDEAVCPCHGSRYRADGTVSTGPATRPLRPLRIEPDPVSGGWIARVS